MIIVKLMGGLGNQMFEYAFGRSLALKHATELKLDTSFLLDRTPVENFTFRNYELDAFNVQASVASKEEIKKNVNGRLSNLMNHLYLYIPFLSKNVYLREPYFHFYSKALQAPPNTYVDGYWQSEKYFKVFQDQIRKDFTLIKPLSSANLLLASQIKNSLSVGIHVRKADYITNFHSKKYYADCNEDYYRLAMNRMHSGLSAKPVFYVFSDEPDWFKKNVKSNFELHFVEGNRESADYEDLYLMSLCKHNIIANSTFSWWAAWLNANDQKKIIAPENWFADKRKITGDLLPDEWIKL